MPSATRAMAELIAEAAASVERGAGDATRRARKEQHDVRDGRAGEVGEAHIDVEGRGAAEGTRGLPSEGRGWERACGVGGDDGRVDVRVREAEAEAVQGLVDVEAMGAAHTLRARFPTPIRHLLTKSLTL